MESHTQMSFKTAHLINPDLSEKGRGDWQHGNMATWKPSLVAGPVPSHGHRRAQNTGSDYWNADDWRVFFDERAAIAEHEGELPRLEAEAQAFECCVVEWMRRNPVAANEPDRCILCSEGMEESEAIAFLNGAGGHVLIHRDCYPGWMKRRRGEAIGALTAMGVGTSDTEDRA